MPTIAQIFLFILGSLGTGFMGLLLWNIRRAIKSFDDTSALMQKRHDDGQKTQTNMLVAITKQQQQIKTLFDRSDDSRSDIVRLEDRLQAIAANGGREHNPVTQALNPKRR